MKDNYIALPKNPIKAIAFYLKHNCDSGKIRMYVNEIFMTDLTMPDINEAIENIQRKR